MIELHDATLTEVKEFLDKTGKHGAQILSLLGRVTPGIHAVLGTEIGREILRDDIKRIEQLMDLVYRGEQTDDDRVELRYLRTRISGISNRLRVYLEGTEEIKKVAGQE